MMRFRIGDWVQISDREDVDYPWLKNHVGQIIELVQIGNFFIAHIEWDDLIKNISNGKFQGHDCRMQCKFGYGWNVLIENLVPADPSFFENENNLDMELGECEELI